MWAHDPRSAQDMSTSSENAPLEVYILTLGGRVTFCFEYLTTQILCCIWLNIDCTANNILAVSKQHVDRNSFVHTNETHATLDQLQHHRTVLSIELPSAGKHQNSRRSLADRGILGKTCRLWLHNVHARSIMHTPNTHPTHPSYSTEFKLTANFSQGITRNAEISSNKHCRNDAASLGMCHYL